MKIILKHKHENSYGTLLKVTRPRKSSRPTRGLNGQAMRPWYICTSACFDLASWYLGSWTPQCIQFYIFIIISPDTYTCIFQFVQKPIVSGRHTGKQIMGCYMWVAVHREIPQNCISCLIAPHSWSHITPHSWSHIAPHSWSHIAPHSWSRIAPHSWSHIVPHSWSHIAPHSWSHIVPHSWSHIAPHSWSHIAPHSWSRIAPHSWSHIAPHSWSHIAPHSWSHIAPHSRSHIAPHSWSRSCFLFHFVRCLLCYICAFTRKKIYSIVYHRPPKLVTPSAT